MSIFISPRALSQPDAFDRVIHQVLAGGDVAILAQDGAADALLDKAMRRLAIQDSRVFRLRATASEGLSIARLVAEVTGRLERTRQDDLVLQEAFGNLTVLDASYDRIVLLISGADALQRSTLRYLQLAMRVGPALQFVLAGAPGFLAVLDTDEFAPLHGRLAAQEAVELRAAGGAALAEALPPAPPRPAPAIPVLGMAGSDADPVPVRKVRPDRRIVLGAGFGLAVACVASGVWLLRQAPGSGPTPAGSQATTTFAGLAPQAPSPGSPNPGSPNPGSLAPAMLPAPVTPALADARGEPSLALPPPPNVVAEPFPSPAIPLPAVSVRKPEMAEPRDITTRLESLYAELEASRRQASRTRAARKTSRAVTTPDEAPATPPDLAHNLPAAPREAVVQKQERFLGTYSTDANGVRSFRANEP